MKLSHPRRTRQGFTLMEMLVVLAILVLLAGMVLPKVLGSSKKANIQAAEVQIRGLKAALDRYALDTNVYPTTEQGLQALVAQPEGSEESAIRGWDGSYLDSDELPKDPWGNAYQYESPPTHGTGDTPDIWSFGPDGQDQTEDDVVSWSTATEDGEAAPGEERSAPSEPAPAE